MTKPVVVSACGDPGGAGALAPVLERLIIDGRVSLAAYAYRQALDILGRRGLAPRAVPNGADAEWFDSELRSCRTAMVLVATSHNGQNYEKMFLAAARRFSAPSMAVLDFWANYRIRFSDTEGRLLYVPDRIAVMDEEARRGLIADGLPEEAIYVTGHPGFDTLAQQREQFTLQVRNAIRSTNGVGAKDIQVLFASQPLRELYGADESDPGALGFQEQSVLDDVIEALEGISLRAETGLTLVIRPHPREEVEAYQNRHSNAIRIVVSKDGDGREIAMASDVVVGMNSMLLVEACYLGCPVVSVQPGLLGPDALPTNAHGLSEAVYRREEIAPVLERVIAAWADRKTALTRRPDSASLPLATSRVVEFVYSMISHSKIREAAT